MNEEDVKELWEQIKANAKLLDSCEGPHDLHPIEDGTGLPRYQRCSKCQGKIDTIDANWYKKGLEHGRKLN